MLDTAYWIARMENPDEIILSQDEIERMNEEYERKINFPDPFKDVPEDRKPELINWWPGYSLTYTDLYRLDPEAVADTVKTRINEEIKYLRSQEYGNALAVKYNDKEIDAFEEEMALDTVKNTVTILDGISVRTTRLMNIPSFLPEQIGMTQAGKMRWGQWNIGVLKIGEPVMVLHMSKTGEYMFVQCEVGYGWLKSEDVAFGTRQEIDSFVSTDEFVVCTGSRVLFYSDESCMSASGWFGMGARLPVNANDNPRCINVPVRKMNGQFSIEQAWLKEDSYFHAGYLPYTRRNIIETAFRLLGNPYDWSGAWFGRQHETTYRDIFACFGFNLPNHGTLFTFFNNNNTTVLHPEMGKEKYYEQILGNEPFLTIQSCGGHCQLYIGEYNNEPIVFDQHGYGYQDENGIWYEVRRCHIGDLRLPIYFHKRDVTFLELK
jgi:hypothetical protein